MLLAGIGGMVLSLGLAVSVRAEALQSSEQSPSDSSPTLLPPVEQGGSPEQAAAPPKARGTRDPAATLVLYTPFFPATHVSSDAEDPPTSLLPLPVSGAQVAPAQREAQRRGQAPAATTPAQRQAAQARPAQPRPPSAGGAQAAQEIQFDQSGLVTHFHVNEGDLRQILELLSRRARMNILISPKVGGTVTLNFEGVSVEEVLASVIKLANLVQKTEGSIHYIYTRPELQEEEEDVKKERIVTKVYKLDYVRADELLSIIRPFLSADVGQKRLAITPTYRFGISESATFVSGGGAAMSAGGGGGGSAAGSPGPGGSPPTGGGPTVGGYQPPTGGNSSSDSDHLIVQDYESNLKIIDQIVRRVDVRPVQVLIEAVIVSVDLEHDRELGVNFAVVDNLANMLGTAGTGTALNGNVGFNPTQLLTSGGKLAQGAVPDAQGFTSATNGIKFGFVANNVTGFVRALETLGSTKILASPRILVLNKQRAEIQLGSRLGFQTLSQNFTSTIQQVQFLNTGTLLRLRPFVSTDGMVRMEIHPERSSGTVVNNIPNQQTAELTTNVMVPDGATLVIGGLMEDEDDFQMQGLPGLSRLPVLGYLFGARQKTEGRRELVVLLTPHIWSPELAMAHAPTPNLAERVQSGAPVGSLASTAGSTPTSFEFQPPSTGTPPAGLPVPAGATAAPPPGAEAAPVGAGIAPAATAPVPGPGVETPPSGAQPGQTGQAPPPPKRRPWRLFSRLLPQESPEPRQNQPPASAAAPSANPSTAAMSQPSVRAPEQVAKRDSTVIQARAEAESLADRSREDQPRISRSGGVAAGPTRHSVERDETFATISERYYGSSRYDRALWWFNRGTIARPERLSAGDLIVIPSARDLDPGQIRPANSRPAAARATDSKAPVYPTSASRGETELKLPRSTWVRKNPSLPTFERADDEGRDAFSASGPRSGREAQRRAPPTYHVVGRFETIRSIARDRLGDSRRAGEIAELNQDRLSEGNQLRPGLRLLLPSDAIPDRNGP
jgi:general secretion pathway protein D